jgi:hypothetical protein
MRRKQKMSSENRMKASFKLTQYLFSKACKDLGFTSYRSPYNGASIIVDTTPEKQAAVSELYLKYILQCSDDTLKTILDASDAYLVRRTQKTLEAIKNELLERVIYEEDSSKNKKVDIS